jgi:hypothetical protein
VSLTAKALVLRRRTELAGAADAVLDVPCPYVDEAAPDRHGGDIEDRSWIGRVEPGKL